jgi:hypothetical protein
MQCKERILPIKIKLIEEKRTNTIDEISKKVV